MLTPFERAVVAHLIADWLFQNHWIVQHKIKLSHPAAWIHTLIHGVALTWALGWQAGLVLSLIHMLIDTRIPLRWWQQLFRQTTNGPAAMHVAIWSDQVLHIITIALWISLF